MSTTSVPMRQRTWLWPVLMSFISFTGIGIVYRVTHKPASSESALEAKRLSVDAAHLDDITQLEDKMFGKVPLTDDEWKRYKSYALGNETAFRQQAARHLYTVHGTVHENEAHALVNNYLTDPDPLTRACALISLRDFPDPTWQEKARKLLSDPSKITRDLAEGMLARANKK